MIRYDCEQGSPEWVSARLGIPTSSAFSKILTPKTRKLSSQAVGYMDHLIAERCTGEPSDYGASGFMERGKELEPEAVAYYEFTTGQTVDRVGFCTTDDHCIGCSPDGLVGDNGGLEIKILSAANHVATLRRFNDGEDVANDEYACQVQGSMWVTGRAWWDRLWWNPAIEPVTVRVPRDDEFISQLAAAVLAFADRVDEAYDKIKSKG